MARFATAGLNAVTPALLALNPQGVYVGVTVVAAAGFLVGWIGFRGRRDRLRRGGRAGAGDRVGADREAAA
ncbi:hypothetical protein BC477_10800 [Clavibacter michiganensis subsp. michiganensis]|uniref:Uncharacterized protein n=1 Tax=Clavibacter michiganensis subsp. michiganensis TaxID=33013 RepID=A0A251XP25_CLAMM|nr:hypothetical protein BC477_10800 [Clavibacter michiganensis subsp. michiganensis]OUE05215.1 hypothetical protein CMMCAS07_09720 [Clavibacter michiganensis subsp. michiganensis]